MRSSVSPSAHAVPSRWPWVAICTSGLVLLLMFGLAVAGRRFDFGAYYGASLAILDGRNPYVDALVWREAGYVTGGRGWQPTPQTAYVYPPALAMALIPLTALPLQIASVVWVAVLFGGVLGTAWLLAAVLTARRDGVFWGVASLLAVALVLFKPVRGALTFSKQADPLILLLLAGMLVACVRRRDGLAGLLLGLAVAIKPFLAVLALWLLWKGAYRATIWAGLVAVVVGFGPLLALGLLPDFLLAASHWAGPAMLASPVGQSTASVLLRLFTVQPYTMPLIDAPWLVAPLQTAVGAGLLVSLALVVSRSRQHQPLVLLLEWGLALNSLLIFGPLTEEHHLAYLALGLTATLALACARWPTVAAARWIGLMAGLLVLLLMVPGTQVIAWGFYSHPDGSIPPPASFATFFFLYATVAAWVLNLLALRIAGAGESVPT